MDEYSLDGIKKKPLPILGYVSWALKREHLRDMVMEYRTKALEDDLDHLILVSKEYLQAANTSARNRKTNERE